MSERQLEFLTGQPTSDDVARLLSVLAVQGWTTRRQLVQILEWDARTIRAVAEAAGDAIVRGPKGFNTFDRATDDEIHACAEIAASQGNKMLEYSLKLKRRLHARIG